MMKPKKCILAKTVVRKDIIEIESDTDTDEVDGKTLALCGEVNTSTNRNNMQIVCADDYDSSLVDLEYISYVAHSYEPRNQYLLEDYVRDKSPLPIMYNVDKEASGKSVKTQKSRAKRKAKSPMSSSVSKRLKTESGRADHRLKTNETQQKRRGRKPKNLKPTSNVRNSQEKNRDVKKEHTRNDKSQMMFRASKRMKTETGREDHNYISKSINTKDTKGKKLEALKGKKILVTKHNSELNSRGHVKDKLYHSFKPHKKENEKSVSSMDKSYSYYLAFLRNSTTDIESKQVKPVKDIMCWSDPDIVTVSDHPFQHRGESPFQADKDGKVIDVEDDNEDDDIFNSTFSKKLMEILINPYDEKEFSRLYNEASRKRPATRCRELRDGREIEYNVQHKLALSYFETHPDFKKKYHRARKDRPRALNLLRGFFFYYEYIALEGAFQPWLHETRLRNLCVDATKSKDIVGNKSKRHRTTAPKVHLK